MARFIDAPPAAAAASSRIGVLLVNLGTPDAPTAAAVKPYLRQFLSDRRVVEIPALLWQPILRGIVLMVRPAKSARKYAAIWGKEGSPLRVWTEKQAKLVKGFLGERHGNQVLVAYAMRYGQPSIPAAMARLREQGCDRLLLVPLYPQYSASSTATACDTVFAELSRYRDQPAVRTIRDFHDHPGYIDALANRIRQHWMVEGRGEHLVMSFHGVPRFTVDKGDPYQRQCQETARLLAAALGLTEDRYTLAFQSRFGRTEWLKPYTSETLAKLGKQGVKAVDVVCPGFVADCLETLEEIALEGKQTFLQAGGGTLRYIPALNDDNRWVHALTSIVEQALQGWLTPSERPAAPDTRVVPPQP
ncbi:ferrochelatase [Chitiniphilus eburneus]|uniref:Ferrochelatase n=1 Tax=Chitiniphilus eburneus TaxID=2571148 RepID=A0A4U0PY28_9NEIS|nr:ferrochelatase [Chitiniphilus eburneus]TJZ73513.1 ferrochelatase [Chitiniphilus eburneus]